MTLPKSSKIRDLRVNAPVPTIGKRTMTAEHCAMVQEMFILINHHQRLAQQIQGNLREMLMVSYGVDIASGQWQINMATGELVQAPTPPPVPKS